MDTFLNFYFWYGTVPVQQRKSNKRWRKTKFKALTDVLYDTAAYVRKYTWFKNQKLSIFNENLTRQFFAQTTSKKVKYR